MESVDPEIGKLVPALFVLCTLAVLFVGALLTVLKLCFGLVEKENERREREVIRAEQRDKDVTESMQKKDDTFVEAVAKIGAACHIAQKAQADKSDGMMETLLEVVNTNTEVLRDVQQIMRRREDREERT